MTIQPRLGTPHRGVHSCQQSVSLESIKVRQQAGRFKGKQCAVIMMSFCIIRIIMHVRVNHTVIFCSVQCIEAACSTPKQMS